MAPWPQTGWPRPVVVVLHGNYDRPEWECETWHKVVGQRAWVLCPRGSPNPWASKEEDRWTYTTFEKLRAEIDAGISALAAQYPGMVNVTRMVLAGFSLGAMLAPALFMQFRGRFQSRFLFDVVL